MSISSYIIITNGVDAGLIAGNVDWLISLLLYSLFPAYTFFLGNLPSMEDEFCD